MRKPQKKILLIISISIVVTSILAYWWYNQITPIGADVTERDIIHDLKVMKREKVDVENVGIFNLYPGVMKYFPDLTEGEGRFVSLVIQGKELLYNEPYIEVKEAMNAWLYLMERKSPEDILGIKSGFKIKGVISQSIEGISKKEFESLYEQVDPELGRELLIEELTKRWVQMRKHEPD